MDSLAASIKKALAKNLARDPVTAAPRNNQPKEPRARAKRANQLFPRGQRLAQEPDDLPSEPALPDEQCDERGGPKRCLPWKERKQRSDAAAQNNAPQRKADFVSHALRHQQLLADYQSSEQIILQSAVNDGWQLHDCAGMAATLEESPLELVVGEVDEVEYIGMQCRFSLQLPCWQCTACEERCKPNPLAFFCWPSSQTQARMWYDVRVLRSYGLLMGNGLSMEAFLGGLNSSHFPLDLYPPQPIKADSFAEPFNDYRRVTDRLLTLASLVAARSELLSQLPKGVFCDCPICAVIPGASQDGYIHAICADACTKPSSYAGVAKATWGIQQHTDTYMDRNGLEGTVQHMHSMQQLDLKGAFAQAAREAAAGEAAVPGGAQATGEAAPTSAVGTDAHDCSASLSCARLGTSNITAGQPCAVRGVVGFVCCHGVPLMGLYCNMPTAEQFVYYLLALVILLRECYGVLHMLHIYIDFACQLKVTWARYAAVLGLNTERMRLMVNWMHGASHNVACQLRNSGRYQADAAYRVGEQQEHAWSQLTDMCGLLRYMTAAHRVDAIQARLSDVAFVKQWSILRSLKAKYAAMVRKEGELENKLASLRVRAYTEGIRCEVEACNAFRDSHLNPKTVHEQPADGWMGDWLALQLVLKSLEGIASCQSPGASTPSARLPSLPLSADMVQLQTRGVRGPHHHRVQVATAKCLKVEVEHGVSALECFKNHGDGNGESQIIKRGLELVVDTELTRYRTQVEQHCKDVHELGLQRDELGPSGKDTRAMSKAIKAKLRQIRQLLDEMAHYQVLGSIQPPATARVTEEQLQAMVRDEPAPWAGESATTSLGKLLYYGRQFHQLLSDRDRCKEQLAVLRLEHGRLLVWLRLMISVCEEACNVVQPGEQHDAHSAVEEAAARKPMMKPGQAFYVMQHFKQYKAMLHEAEQWQRQQLGRS
ncbi:hypothetical protein V8C86DRAFT_2545091 [Haematococcus lacustris]